MAFLTCDFFSYHLGMDVQMNVLLPEKRQEEPKPAPDAKYKVLYLLHGHSDDHSAYIRKSLIEVLVRRYDLAVVMPDAHRSGYANMIHGHRYYDYMTEDVMMQAPNFFPISTKPEDTYIAGLSMGGAGAMKIGLNNPGRFAGVGCMSAGAGCDGKAMADACLTINDLQACMGTVDFTQGDREPAHEFIAIIYDDGGSKPFADWLVNGSYDAFKTATGREK